ncbi:MAG: carboxypeptidase-like regulatory domain-containing protein, partial [Tannerella sp.]|nr:carboxypeptidase-like regulatory domain-containing protein [Tannerella sp.]
MKKYILLLFILSISFPLFAQQKISGTVLEASTNEPVPGASVYVKSSTEGTVSDDDGRFSFATGRPLP